MLLADIPFSRYVFLSIFLDFIPRVNSTCNYWILDIPIYSQAGFSKVTWSRTWGFLRSEEKLKHVLKTDGSICWLICWQIKCF